MARILLITAFATAVICCAPAHAALGSRAGDAVTAVSEARDDLRARGPAPARTPGASWYVGVGGITLLALARLRRLGLERLRREQALLNGHGKAADT